MATSKEIKDGYTSTLQDLTCNSKPLISVLTMLAEENVAHAKDIVEAIEAHLSKDNAFRLGINPKIAQQLRIEQWFLFRYRPPIGRFWARYREGVRTDVKLPVLYLIDCIIKNVGGPYTSAFCNNIVPLFCSVFQMVDEKTRTEMYKLRQTWNDVLPKSKLYALDVQTQQMDPAWPITAAPPNIHFNPKFLKTSAGIGKKEPVSLSNKPTLPPLVTGPADPATLDMQQKLIIKQKELLELQQKKLELELLQTQVKLQEQLKKTNTNSDDLLKMSTKAKNMLLKPEVAKQLLEESGDTNKTRPNVTNPRLQNNTASLGNNVPKIAPVNPSLIAASRPIRDPRLLRQQATQQNTVNSNVQLENKTSTINTLDNKVVNSKMSNRRDNIEARFVNKDEIPKTKNLSRIPLKSKRPLSPSNKTTKSNRSSKSSSGSGSTSSLDSPVKSAKSNRPTSKSPSKYKKSGSSSSSSARAETNKKLGKIVKNDRKSPTKDSGFKDVKGLTKNRNYIRRNRDSSLSPEPELPHHDVDLRIPPPEKQPRVQTDSKEDKCDMSIQGMDVDLRQMPAVVGKKRPSIEASEIPTAKKTKSEMFDVLFGSEDVDLRQLPKIPSPKEMDRPPTPPPPPIISNKLPNIEKENVAASPKKETSPKANLDILRAKLANATSKDKFNKSRLIFQAEQKKVQEKAPLDDSLSKIIISPADEESIKAGNMTKAQESALMHKILAQIENQKLKEAKRKENEENVGNVSLQPISDDELDSDMNDSVEIIEDKPGDRPFVAPAFSPMYPDDPFDSRFRRDPMPMRRGPIRPPVRPGPMPWVRPMYSNPVWRQPFPYNNMNYEDNNIIDLHSSDRVPMKQNNMMRNRSPDMMHLQPIHGNSLGMDGEMIEPRCASPFSNSNDASDLVVNCSSQDNTKSINIDGKPRDIVFYDDTAVAFMSLDDPREISFQSGSRRVFFDDQDSYVLMFNDPDTEVMINGHLHRVRLGAPTREIYIDGKPYECFFGGPGIEIELDGKLTLIKMEGPIPQVKIGTVKRTDLVAGKINLIIDAKTIVPVFLDARLQKFEIDGMEHTLKFTDALQTVLINDVPFKVEFGGLPKPITVNGKKHFVRFSVLPRGIKPGHIYIKDMDGCRSMQSDNENSQEPFDANPDFVTNTGSATSFDSRKRFRESSPDRNSNSPNSIQNLLQQPTIENLDSILSNVLVAASSLPTANHNGSGGYQIGNTEPQERPAEDTKTVPVFQPPLGQPTLNINDLFQKLVATGIVTSTIAEPVATIPPVIIPTIQEKIEVPEVTIPKTKRQDMVVKLVDFSKPSTLKTRQPALIQTLYSGMQCSSCGMRFPPENSKLYSQHLDWHFRQNRKGKKNIRKATSRRWYYSISDWNNYEEIEDLEEREKCYFENQQKEQIDGVNEEGEEEIEIPSVPADSNIPDPRCEVCQEKFEQFYNEEKEEWHLRMAVRIDDRTYHPLCYEDYQASLVDTTMEDSLTQTMDQEKETNGIPGLEVPLDETKDDISEIIIDDVESVESVVDSPLPEPVKDEGSITDKDSAAPKADEEEDDDDDVIINEVQPERINLDEYEFKRNVDEDLLSPNIVKTEPVDDGFTDIENFKLGDIKIKTEPITPDETFEDIGQIVPEPEAISKEQPIPSSDTTHAELVTTIDGNVELNTGVSPSSGIGGKIKINISKQLPVIAPKENKDIPLEIENTVEPIDPTQPLPPGEEPVQLNLKPALQGIELKKLPPVNKGSELTGLCSIM